jgi:CheY-like chemotaxis protein/signal transduction histidine kinase
LQRRGNTRDKIGGVIMISGSIRDSGARHASSFYPVLWRLLAGWTVCAVIFPGIAGLVAVALLGLKFAGFAAAAGLFCISAGAFVIVGVPGLARLVSMPADALATVVQQDADGEIAKASVSTLATDFQRLEQAVLRSTAEKQSKLSELQRSREGAQAERFSRAEFFSSISHELRTPLNAIIGYAMLLSEDMAGKGEDDAARDIDRILISGRRLLRLINDILDFSRLDAGNISVDRAGLDLRALLDTVAAEYGPGSNALKTLVAPDAAVLIGDQSKTRQALTCLLGAVTSDHSSDLSLSADVEPNRETHVRFTVTGNRLNLAQLSASQGQLVPAPSSAITAAGLAGSVVHRLVNLLGGEIMVSADAQTVALILPRNPDADGRPLAVTHVAAITANSRTDRNARTILVIDDDEATIDLLERWLTDKGYTVMSATSGAEGLAKARSARPDAIVLDVFMPGKSGYEVLSELRGDPQMKSIPVIIESSDDNRPLGLQAGAAEVLVKPLTPNRLGDILKALGGQLHGDILVVDDEADSGEIVRRYGRMAGLKVRVAANVVEGIKAARIARPDAIVLDLCMPGPDGFAMLDALANDAELRDIPVMVLSQLDLSAEQHGRISDAGHLFHAKWKTSPVQIVENLKTLVAS